jgi:DNA-binding NarL/FixJ family response regulator
MFDQGSLDFEPAQIARKQSTRQSVLPPHKEQRLTNVGRRLLAQLSPRELCVARLLVAVGTNRSIASRMGTSIETVKTHMVHMFHKVGVEDRLSLAMALIRHGVIACPCLGALEREQGRSVGSCARNL